SDSNGNKQEHQLNTIGNSRWEFSFAPLQTANYDIVLEVSGVQIDGSPLSETIKADQFYFDQADLLGASAQSPAEPADAEPDAAPEQDTELKPWAIGALVAGNLLVLLLGYFAYRLIAGKGNKDELAEIENTLAAKPEMKPVVEMSVTPDPQPQLQPQLQPIDVADDSQILSMDSPEMSMSDDLMADNLFPLDNMEDPKDKT